MHVDWAWIKQRPHFLANQLMKNHELFVIYPFSRHRKVMQKMNKKNFEHLPYVRIPGIGIMCGINGWLWKLYINIAIGIFKPEVIWIGHPYYGWYIPSRYRGKVIYDCMDDHIALENNQLYKNRISEYESNLANKADLIFTSSERIEQVLSDRIKNDVNKFCLVRNGFDGKIIECQNVKSKKDKVTIGYIGTIAEWFDFSLIISSLEKYEKLEYHLIGPCRSAVACYSHPRIIMHSTVEHNKLYDTIKEYDCLIMPFVLNDIVESVDPVKLYEYINFNKNIISIRYDEISRFEPYVYFYSSADEYNALIGSLIAGKLHKKYTEKMRNEFLLNNSWGARIRQIENKLEKL